MALELQNDRILVDNGDMFEGSRDQFRDCFFDNADNENIIGWCKDNGWKLEINGIVLLGDYRLN